MIGMFGIVDANSPCSSAHDNTDSERMMFVIGAIQLAATPH
jgi:hypothetical protein